MCSLPLYLDTTQPFPRRRPNVCNAGLWYNKFCNLWPDKDWNRGLGTQKIEWIKTVSNGAIGERVLITEMLKRQEALVKHHEGLCIQCNTSKSFVTGMGLDHPIENGFAWHYQLGVPYLPGSGVKGAIKSWAREWTGTKAEVIQEIFGDPGEGSIIFLDMIPRGPVYLKPECMTPHYAPYHQKEDVPGDWHAPVPIPFLAVAAGQGFQFGVLPTSRTSKEHMKMVEAWINEALPEQGLGAKTSSDYGKLSVVSVSFEDWFDGQNFPRRTPVPYDWIAEELGKLSGSQRSRAIAHVRNSAIMEAIAKTMKKKKKTGKEFKLGDILNGAG